MKFLPLLISLTIISPNIYSNPLDQDIEDEFSAFSPELTEEEKKQEEAKKDDEKSESDSDDIKESKKDR